MKDDRENRQFAYALASKMMFDELVFVSASNSDYSEFFDINKSKSVALIDGILLNKSKG